jgi:hypothetical protein
VHFSPKIVEKRIPYNDEDGDDIAIDADVSEFAPTPSPRKTSMKQSTRHSPHWDDNMQTPNTDSKTTKKGNRRRRKHSVALEQDLAAWDPRRHSSSGSSHVPSPYLPSVKRYAPDHPNAGFDPKRRESSSYESLEYSQQSRKLGRRKRGAKKAGKEKLKEGGEEPAPVPGKSAHVSKGKRKAKSLDPTYRDVEPSPTSSLPKSPVLWKPRKASDPAYR